MSKLEYLNPSDWSLHVIDGENECVPEGWILVPKGATLLVKLKHLNICVFYRMVNGIWGSYESGEWADFPENYRHIENPILKNGYEILWSRKMKEYLVERDGKYELVVAYHLKGGIEVPEGAEIATACGLAIYFWKPSENKTFIDGVGWSEYGTESICTLDSYLEDSDVSIIWKRKPSLNNQCVEIEEVRQNNVDSILSERQSQYGCYEDVAKTTQDILKALRIGNYENMPAPHQEALHMIASKMARLAHGDANHIDSWVDIGGYSKLIVNLIEGGK